MTDLHLDILDTLVRPRQPKPRRAGSTWISLFGEGPRELADLLEMAGDYIDRAKLAYGSSLLASPAMLQQQTKLLTDAGIVPYPGGTILEMALREGAYDRCLDWCARMGFTGIEICDGVIEIDDEQRAACISSAVQAGFSVTTVVQEVIRKPIIEVVTLAEKIARAQADLAAGADQIHIVFQSMARGETPSDVVGPVKRDHVHALNEAIGAENLVWEAMTTDDQIAYLRLLGPDVSLGHAMPSSVVQLEAQRRGLGYESFWSEVWKRPHWS